MASNQGDGGGGRERRQPQSLQGILKFCAEQTQSEDPTENRPAEPMSEEKRKFLEDFLSSLKDSDPVKVMLEDVKVIMSPGDSDKVMEVKEGALEDLQVHCEDIDLANDFHKIGGYTLFDIFLCHEHEGFRWRTADLIATLAQNNDYSQQCLLEGGMMGTLVNILDSDSQELPRVKALYALSCMTRDFPPAQEVFINKHDGFSVLVRAMQTDIQKLQIKASFLLASICQENPAYKSILVDMGLLDQLVSLIHRPHAAYHEHLMRALLVLTEDNQRAQQECQRSEFKMKEVLGERIRLLKGQEEHQEELEYATKLLDLCFRGSAAEVER